jgi:hypothetical protein
MVHSSIILYFSITRNITELYSSVAKPRNVPRTDKHMHYIFVHWHYIRRLTDECMVGPDECQNFILAPIPSPPCPTLVFALEPRLCHPSATAALAPPLHGHRRPCAAAVGRRHMESSPRPPVATARHRPVPPPPDAPCTNAWAAAGSPPGHAAST